MKTPPTPPTFPALTWSQVKDTSTHIGKTGTIPHFVIEWSISRTANGAPYVLRSYLAKHSNLRQHYHTVEQAQATAAKLWQQWLFRAGLQPLPVLEFMDPGEAQRAAHNLSREHQLFLMSAAGWLPCPKAGHWHPPGMTDGPHNEDKAVLMWIDSLNRKAPLP